MGVGERGEVDEREGGEGRGKLVGKDGRAEGRMGGNARLGSGL